MNVSHEPLLIVEGIEQSKVDLRLPDAGLPPAPGVQSWCVLRATRDAPQLADTYGWTYHHHVDMACWRGRLYVGWNSCEKDEDVWPSRELYSTSLDGATWDPPREMFPQGMSTPLRIYFFHAAERMLAIAGLRIGTADTDEETKCGLVVREILPDHTLGNVYTLQARPSGERLGAMFDESTDSGFVTACRQLLADTVFLEQQDLGRLLGPRRMKWHDAASWPGGKVPGDSEKWVSGKAFSFVDRPDGSILGVSKMGFTTVSRDNGESWDMPHVPPGLVTGKAKVWSQRTADGRYALVYNPTARGRYPLIVVGSDDCLHFSGMRVVHGELPIQRYEGRFRSIGPQYVRGISKWSDDGSRKSDDAIWLVYSMSKEDIWVSRVPLPVGKPVSKPEPGEWDHAEPGPRVPGWNTYCPKWASVRLEKDANGIGNLRLEDSDPYDYARADRVFPDASRVTITFELMIPVEQFGAGELEIELVGNFGSPRPVRLRIDAEGNLSTTQDGQPNSVKRLVANQWTKMIVNADASSGTFDVAVDENRITQNAPFIEPADVLSRITFRTGAHRGVGGTRPVAPGSDVPGRTFGVLLRRVQIDSQ